MVIANQSYRRSWVLLDPERYFLESTKPTVLPSPCFSESWSTVDFLLRCRSSTCRRHKDSLSFLGNLLYRESFLRRFLAVDHEVKTVLPSSNSFVAASVVITSVNRALYSCAHRWDRVTYYVKQGKSHQLKQRWQFRPLYLWI